jgi:hypothetical protein
MKTSSNKVDRECAIPRTRNAAIGSWIVPAVFAGACLAFGVCGQAVANEGLTVRVLLFSGRPDPSFAVTEPAQIVQFAALLKAAHPTQKLRADGPAPAKLGYKGLIVENVGNIPDLPRRLVVYRDEIEAGTAEKQFFSDPQAQVESFLLDLAIQRGVIPENVLRRMREKQ